MHQTISPSLLEALSSALPDRVASGADVCRQHANTLTWIANEPPDVVVWPETVDDVAAVLRLASHHRVPVIPFGAGTSLEGHVNAPAGGISIDLSHMTLISALNSADLDVTVEAGVTRDQLETHLRHSGLFFSVDPGTGQATLGGMAATRASGTNSVRYGTMRDNVLSLTVVLADGTVVETGGRARKSAAGYDLTRLFIGSEGTLGIITSLRLKLHPRPQSVVAAVAAFPTLENACDTVIAAIQSGLSLARIELLDVLQIRAVNAYAGLSLAEQPTLFLAFHGTPGATADSVTAFADIAAQHGALKLDRAEDEDARRRLWRARHDALWAVQRAWPKRTAVVTDVCVPLSNLARCITATEADFREAGIPAPITGHVGDGNFHAIAMIDADDARERATLKALLDRLIDRALAAGGTCTGEHGIGQGKTKALCREVPMAIPVMGAIKQALDPLGILNPGKIFAP